MFVCRHHGPSPIPGTNPIPALIFWERPIYCWRFVGGVVLIAVIVTERAPYHWSSRNQATWGYFVTEDGRLIVLKSVVNKRSQPELSFLGWYVLVDRRPGMGQLRGGGRGSGTQSIALLLGST